MGEYPRYKHHTYEAEQYGVVPDALTELARQGVGNHAILPRFIGVVLVAGVFLNKMIP